MSGRLGRRLIGLGVGLLAVARVEASVLFVDDDAPPGGDGTSWMQAMSSLQDALAVARNGGVDEIRVATGRYTPDRGAGFTVGEQDASFELVDGIALRGGYAGFSGADPGVRDLDAYPSVLSGDLGGDDVDGFTEHEDNSFHVVRGSGLGGESVLDGFVVRGGQAYGPGDRKVGGGLRLEGCRTMVIDCRFERCRAENGGGGVFSTGLHPSFVRCTFVHNEGGWGAGALANHGGSFTDCHFESNEGPGLRWFSVSAPIDVRRCTFIANEVGCRAEGPGRFDACHFEANSRFALDIEGGTHLVTACAFESNESPFAGAALRISGLVRVEDSIFRSNTSAAQGGAVAGPAVLVRCVFEDNAAAEGGAVAGTVSAFGCDFVNNVSGNSDGGGAISGGGVVRGCRFHGNRSGRSGGAIYSRHEIVIEDSVFSGNEAIEDGGAIAFLTSDQALSSVTNCSIVGNQSGGHGGGIKVVSSGPHFIVNSILWGNEAGNGTVQDAQIQGKSPVVDYSCVEGLTWTLGGFGNIGDDPSFTDPDGDDGVIGTRDDDFRIVAGSPCIDAGDSHVVAECALDGAGLERRFDDLATWDQGLGPPPLPDMGAHEFGAPAGVDCDADRRDDACAMDLDPFIDCNGDGLVDSCSIAVGAVSDCNLTGIPDDCEPELDCDRSGVPDSCEIMDGTASDCNRSGFIDSCEVEYGWFADCDGDGVLDECRIESGASDDCNGNDVPDECDIDSGASLDCNGNGIPDECEPDCNDNGRPDACDIADGTSEDLDANGIPDECQADCNRNGVLDTIDIESGASADCNGNGVPDECDITSGRVFDCNGNGVPDACDLADDPAADCNGNGVPDSCDIESGISSDRNGNGVPDACELDCNGNDQFDYLDLLDGTSADCNGNRVPDECDVAMGGDCNANGIPDECDVDCNGNGVPDDCDLESGTSDDCDGDGVPDECALVVRHTVASPVLSPLHEDSPQSHSFVDPPIALGPVEIVIRVSADLAGSDPIRIEVNEDYLGSHFGGAGVCSDPPDEVRIVLEAEEFNALIPGGTDATFEVLPSLMVDEGVCDESFATISLSYDTFGSADANHDGVIDACQCLGDLDGDGVVEFRDLVIVLGSWGPCGATPCPADLSGADGVVGLDDLLVVFDRWGTCPS